MSNYNYCAVCDEKIYFDNEDAHTYHTAGCPTATNAEAPCDGHYSCGADCHAHCCPTCNNALLYGGNTHTELGKSKPMKIEMEPLPEIRFRTKSLKQKDPVTK